MTTMTATYNDGFLFVLWTAPGTLDDDDGFSVLPVEDKAEPHTIRIMGEYMTYDELPDYMHNAVDSTYEKLEWVVD